jgi:tyrosyl-tRNA synthetase
MEIIERFHSEEDAMESRDEFERIFAKKGKPDEIEARTVFASGDSILLVDVIVDAQLCSSKSEARRMIEQRAVEINDEKVTDIKTSIPACGEILIKVGKRKFAKVSFDRK